MYIVYVLKSEIARKSYVGITDNLQRRIEQHNSGNSFYSRRYMPWKVVYTEKVEDRKVASKREKYFKTAAGRRYLKRFVFTN